MSTDPRPRDEAELDRFFARRSAQNAFAHLREVDARTLAVLQHIGLLEKALPDGDYEKLTALLRSSTEASPIEIPPGPHLVLESQEAAGELVCVSDLVLAPNREVRLAALSHFRDLERQEATLLTPRTSRVLGEDASAAGRRVRWRSAALRINSALHGDFLCNLAGVKQLYQIGSWRELPSWLERVLRPSIPSLESIQLQFWSLESEPRDLGAEIRNWARESSDLRSFLSRFFSSIGHLPIDPDQLGTAIQHLGLHRDAEDVWETVWEWADELGSPLARYHACQFFLADQSLIPAGMRERFWKEIEEIVLAPDAEAENLEWGESWRIRIDLAQHYCAYFECELPGYDSGRLAGLAWWLGDRVAEVFGADQARIAQLRQETLTPVCERSHRYRTLGHPPVGQSLLRYATLHCRPLWSLSILNGLGGKLKRLGPSGFLDRPSPFLARAFVAVSLFGLPLAKASTHMTNKYAFAKSWEPLVEEWPSSFGDFEGGATAADLWEFAEGLFGVQWLPELLRRIPKTEPEALPQLLHAFRFAAYTEPETSEVTWTNLQSEEWLTPFLGLAKPWALETLLDALLELQAQKGDEWRVALPHTIASALQASSVDEEQAEVLFAFLVMASIATNTTSGLARLREEVGEAAFSAWASRWVAQIERLQEGAPEWTKGRLRPVLTALHVTGADSH